MNLPARSLALLLVIPLVGAACGQAAAKPHVPSTLTVAVTSDVQHFNPFLATDETSKLVDEPLFGYLYQTAPDLSLQPDLADGPPVLNSAGTIWTVHLKPEIFWSDRQPITADDLVFTAQALLSGTMTGKTWTGFGPVRSPALVEKVNPTTVNFLVGQPYAPFPAALAIPVLPRHVLDPNVPGATGLAAYDRGPSVTSGPFTFASWEKGSRVVLDANPRYHLGRPHYDHLRFEVMSDTDAADAVASGKAQWNPDVAFGSATEAAGRQDHLYSYPGSNYYAVVFNTRAGHLFDRKEARQAFAYALDQASLVKGATGGAGVPVQADIALKSWAYPENLLPVQQNLDQAKSLLGAAGWTTGADGVAARPQPGTPHSDLQPASTQRLAGHILVPSGSDLRNQAAQLIAGQLKSIGAALDVQAADPPQFDQALEAGNFDLAIAGFDLGLDPDNYDTFHSSQVPGPASPDGKNLSAIQDGGLDQLLTTERTLVGSDLYLARNQRSGAVADVETDLHQLVPVYFLWSQVRVQAFSHTVGGVQGPSADYFTGTGRNSQVFYNWFPEA